MRGLIQPGIVGGLVAGVLSVLPIVSLGNACCCLWIVSGGVVAAYLLQQNQSLPITSGDGALVGLLAGVVAAFVITLLSIPQFVMSSGVEQQALEEIFDAVRVPPEVRDFMTSPAGRAVGIAGSFVLSLLAGAVFSTLGGLLGAALFRKRLPPPAVDGPIEE
jgi:MFS superfamily sulfate permease-like transporter